jgi:hypothetical protein
MSCVKICAVRATQNIAVFFLDGSGCMFCHHVAGLHIACLQAPDNSGHARASIYFAQHPAVFKGKHYEEQYVITYITNVSSYYMLRIYMLVSFAGDAVTIVMAISHCIPFTILSNTPI